MRRVCGGEWVQCAESVAHCSQPQVRGSGGQKGGYLLIICGLGAARDAPVCESHQTRALHSIHRGLIRRAARSDRADRCCIVVKPSQLLPCMLTLSAVVRQELCGDSQCAAAPIPHHKPRRPPAETPALAPQQRAPLKQRTMCHRTVSFAEVQ